ncbi:hypothetical protein Acr_22g0002550 [Actinidia rufa]|uniref:Retrotransposon gag domain-containing protein n=1 Tax=Actinidia rufa TaxID=165716 RepID=A0A7J0GJ67_9ERIC|nr:hypothetical protein Acr_22g0002550 [Actinidia rufa]
MSSTSSISSHIAYPELINLAHHLKDRMNLRLLLNQVSHSHGAISIWHSPLLCHDPRPQLPYLDVAEVSTELSSNSDCWLLIPNFYHNCLASSLGATVLNTLCTCIAVYYLDSTNNPLNNRARPMVNADQAPDLEGIHREMHGITEQIRIMNKRNARLVQHFARNNPPTTTTPVPEDADRSRGFHRSDGESLKDYVRRFNQGVLEVEDSNDKVVIMAMMEGLCTGPLFDFLSKSNLENLSALQSWQSPNVGGEERMITRGRNLILDEQTIGAS